MSIIVINLSKVVFDTM